MVLFEYYDIFLIFGLLILSVIVGSLASNFVPDMRLKENKNKNSYTGLEKKKPDSKKSTSKNSTKSKQPAKTTSKSGTSITSSNRLSPDDEILKLPLDKMSWKEFERLCFLYYKAKGYKPELTKDGADGGVDLIYYSPYHKGKVAVQIKHRIGSGNQIDVKLIRELVAAKRNHNCILAEFITTGGYSNTALAEAGDRKIQCQTLDWVENKIVKWQKEELQKKKLIRA